jgi:hypothetical protein
VTASGVSVRVATAATAGTTVRATATHAPTCAVRRPVPTKPGFGCFARAAAR